MTLSYSGQKLFASQLNKKSTVQHVTIESGSESVVNRSQTKHIPQGSELKCHIFRDVFPDYATLSSLFPKNILSDDVFISFFVFLAPETFSGKQ